MCNMKYLLTHLLILKVLTSNYTHKDFYNSIKSMPIEKQFNLWAEINKKDYTQKVEEKQLKFNAFKNNLDYINEQNNRNKGFSLGLGPFSDMTFEEFKGLFSNTDTEQKSNTLQNMNTISSSDEKPIDFTNSVNWESYFNVKDSKNCFSGAESVVSLMEFFLKKDFNVQTRLSSQSYVDCYLSGCKNFGINDLINFFKENGAYEEKDYPFTGEKGVCFFQRDIISNKCDFTPPFARITGSEETSFNKFEDFYELLNKKPFILKMFLTRDIQNYTGGILDYTEVALNVESLPMILVEITDQYFKLLPSFGKSYGENGFVKIGYKYKKGYFHFGAYSQYQVTGAKLERNDS